jgi:hypothetical protein
MTGKTIASFKLIIEWRFLVPIDFYKMSNIIINASNV